MKMFELREKLKAMNIDGYENTPSTTFAALERAAIALHGFYKQIAGLQTYNTPSRPSEMRTAVESCAEQYTIVKEISAVLEKFLADLLVAATEGVDQVELTAIRSDLEDLTSRQKELLARRDSLINNSALSTNTESPYR